jgi:hypothetical protein
MDIPENTGREKIDFVQAKILRTPLAAIRFSPAFQVL